MKSSHSKTAPEAAFLPAALEIENTPPHPLARTTLWSVCGLFCITIGWAFFGELDIVAVAPGKIVAGGRTKFIQASELGVVSKIHVRDGSIVRQGDLLLELDSRSTQADVSGIEQQQSALLREQERLRRYVAWLEQPTAHGAAPALQQDNDLLGSIKADFDQKHAALESTRHAKAAERLAVLETISRIEQTLPLTQKRFDALQALGKNHLVSEHQILELQEKLITDGRELAAAKARKQALDAEIQHAISQRESLRAEQIKHSLERLEEIAQTTERLAQEHVKAATRDQRQLLHAPVDGVVQQLAVHTIGGVVQAAEKLMAVVPVNETMEVEVQIQNKDIGFIESGQTVTVKLDTFPFTRYGTLSGKVISLGRDAVAHEQLGLVFTARIGLEKSTLKVDEAAVPVVAGMSAIAEVHTGTQTLAQYLLTPLLGRWKEAARER